MCEEKSFVWTLPQGAVCVIINQTSLGGAKGEPIDLQLGSNTKIRQSL